MFSIEEKKMSTPTVTEEKDILNVKPGNSGTNYDYSEYDLTDADFQGFMMAGSSFRKATLDNTNFNGANLEGADLRVDYMMNAKFNNANLRDVNLENIRISAKFKNTILDGAKLSNSTILLCTMGNTSFKGASMRCVQIDDVIMDKKIQKGVISFENADLTATNIDFRELDKINIMLNGAKLTAARLVGFRLLDQEVKDADFSKTRLFKSKVYKTIFKDCTFVRTKLKGVLFSHCTFNSVIFDHSTFKNVRFTNCIFNDCNFGNTVLDDSVLFKQVKMTGCTFYKCRSNPLHSEDTMTMSFDREAAHFTKCDFIETNLSFSEIPDFFTLKECDFTRMKLFLQLNKSILKNCKFREIGGFYGNVIQTKIEGCTFMDVNLEGTKINGNTISNTTFEGGYIRCDIKSNTISKTTLRKFPFIDSTVEDNKLEGVVFEDIEKRGGSFLNNGTEGYTFKNGIPENNQDGEDMP